GIECRPLHTSHAFHSGLMEPAVAPFVDAFSGVPLAAPKIPYVSNLTGDWITEAQATDPRYYGQHIRHAVKFSDRGLRLLAEPDQVFLEVRRGNTLSGLVRQHTKGQGGHVILSSLRHVQEQASDAATVTTALGRLWVSGAAVDWAGVHANEQRRRVP